MKTRTSVAVAAFLLGMSIGVPALAAQTAYPLQTATTVAGDTGDTGDTGETGKTGDTGTGDTADTGDQETAGAAADRSGQAAGSLPVTGGDVIGLTLLGAGALAAGTVLVRRTRRS
jgi:LPXTG-motif cell wall-anchored protein